MVIQTFVCPSDPRSASKYTATVNGISDDYGLTWYAANAGKNFSTRDGVMYYVQITTTTPVRYGSRHKITDLTDVTSNTILAGERPPSPDGNFEPLFWGWWCQETFHDNSCVATDNSIVYTLSGGNAGTPCPNPDRFRPGNINNYCDLHHFWSNHQVG